MLGKGARDKGADCSRIPLRSGIGWVWCDGETEPTRVRAAWVTDTDIAAHRRHLHPQHAATQR